MGRIRGHHFASPFASGPEGIMEYWNTGIMVGQAEQFNIRGKALGLSPKAGFPALRRAYAPLFTLPIKSSTPILQHSNTPEASERS